MSVEERINIDPQRISCPTPCCTEELQKQDFYMKIKNNIIVFRMRALSISYSLITTSVHVFISFYHTTVESSSYWSSY